MSGVPEILEAVTAFFVEPANDLPLSGRRVLVTSGPTHEEIDPVRFIANRSSGKQGHAVAQALAALGADTTLVSGPVSLPDPEGLKTVHVQTALQMLVACENQLPVDVAVCAAAVADWRLAETFDQKLKKSRNQPPALNLTENPDILATLANRTGNKRPSLVVGFAAETENLLDYARSKLEKKSLDMIAANIVGVEGLGFESSDNELHVLWDGGQELLAKAPKEVIASQLVGLIARCFAERSS